MPGKLTKKQSLFVQALARGLRPTAAAREADYSDPQTEGYRLLQLQHVRESVKQRRDALIQGNLAQLAMGAMRDLMGEDTPAATRYQASKWVLEQAGHKGPDADSAQQKDLTDMDADELAQAVTSGMSALSELAEQLKGTHNVDGHLREVRELAHVEDAEDAELIENDDSDAGFLG